MTAPQLCVTDSYLRRCSAQVLSCEPVTAAGKKGAPKRWGVQLSQSVLYAEGGGQPADHGDLTAEDGTFAAVVDVQRDASGTVVHTVTAPLPVGAACDVELDWDRRFDHMQHHTGQHLLSAVAEELAGAQTLSWELHVWQRREPAAAAPPLISVELDAQSLTPEQVTSIEARCNEEIRKATAVRARVVDASQAAEVTASPLFRGTLPPADKLQAGLRMLELEGLDLNACGGTHLRSLSELQLLKVAGATKQRGNVVLQFIAGGRALAALTDALMREAWLTAALSCPPAEHEQAVTKLQAERRALGKELRSAQDGLAGALAERLLRSMPPSKVVALHRSGADMQFLNSLAAAISEADAQCTALLTADDGAVRKANADVAGAFLLQGPTDVVQAAGPAVAAAVAGKGGGRPGRMQGKAAKLQHAAQARSAIEDVVAQLRA